MIHLLRPVVVAIAGAAGVVAARDAVSNAPAIVVGAAVVAVVAAALRERGAAVAALGVGAAASFVSPAGLGPLLVAAGVVLSCDIAAVDSRLTPWRDVIDAAVAVPAVAGLAGTVAAQPSYRGVALGVATGLVVVVSAWRHSRVSSTRPGDLAVLSGIGLLAAFVVALGPQRVDALGDLPVATVQAADSLAAGLAVFVLVVLIEAVRRERAAVTRIPAPLRGGRANGTRRTISRPRP